MAQQDPPATAPPLEAGPPSYNTIAAYDRQYPTLTGRNRFAHSVQYAGASVGRWFGVHDDPQLGGWQRTGTLPHNAAAMPTRYITVPQNDDMPSNEQQRTPLEVTHESSHESQQEAAVQRRRSGNTLRRVANTLTNIGRRKKPDRNEVMKSLPKFWPVMTILIGIVEVSLLIAVIVTQGLAPIKLTPEIISKEIIGFNNQSEIVTRQVVPNFFIGPSKPGLIHTGGMYTPCMRENIEFQIEAAKDRLAENSDLRCCHSIQFDQCGMLPQDVCLEKYGGEILGGTSRCREELNETDTCSGEVTLHPCCVGILGECVITTIQNCSFQDGHWHPEALLCSDVGTDCFKDICEFSWIHRTIGQQPLQTLRFVSAIFLYDGVVHLVVIGLLKVYNSWTIERRIGWLRILCVYILSGIGGYLVSGIFDATTVSVGGSGALFGLLGVLLVEVLQGWKWVKKPFGELAKIISVIIVLFVLGTLPYIDNFSQIGGFIFGVLASFIFVPYITVGKWDRAKKLCLILTAVPIILALYLVGFVAFFNLPNPDFCRPYCGYINCIPYTNTFCEDFITTVLSGLPITQFQDALSV